MLFMFIYRCKIFMKDQQEQLQFNSANLASQEENEIRKAPRISQKKYSKTSYLVYIVIFLTVITLNYFYIKAKLINHVARVPITNQSPATKLNTTKINMKPAQVNITPTNIQTKPTKINIQPKPKPQPDIPAVPRFQKIFWIYTENQFQTEGMHELVYLHHFNDTAHKFGYDFRFANSQNSYDWLSEETTAKISKAMQNSKVDDTVHNLLKIALLMENGGVLISQFDIFFRGESLKWIENMFEPQMSSQNNETQYLCQPEKSYIYMVSDSDHYFKRKYDTFFIAAVPNSDILKDSFQTLINFIQTGTFPQYPQLNIVKRNLDTNVSYAINSLEDSINYVIYQYLNSNISESENKSLCQKYGVQQRKISNIANMRIFNEKERVQVLKEADLDHMFIKKIKTDNIHILRGVNNGPMIGLLNSIIENHVDKNSKHIEDFMPNSILDEILNAPGNKEVLLTQLPERKVQLCLIVLDDLDKIGVKEAIKTFRSQQLKNWKQVLFAKDINDVPKINDTRIVVVQSSFNEVRNIEVAVTKHCQPKGYAVLLHAKERFNHNHALEVIIDALQTRDTIGAFISLQQDKQLIKAVPVTRFNRRLDATQNISKIQQILNHFRIFSIQSFKYIPQFDLRDIHGNYFKDRSIFLMTLLQMIRIQIKDFRALYLIKKYSDLWNVPRKSALIDMSTFIKINKKDEVDRELLVKTKTRYQCQALQETINQLLRFKIPFTKMLAFNNGDQFVPTNKKQGPEIIPKIIHQVWFGNAKKLSPAQQYFYRKTEMMYPNYQIKIWRQQNITKQNFPLTYDVIQTLINFNKHSPYNKLITVADIMRHQILYHQGGFWKDAGVNFLRPILDEFTRYKLVLTADKTFRYRWLQGMRFFAHVPKFQNMFRINSYRNINRMRIYSNNASSIAGPIDFRQLVVGQQEYDPEFLIMPYETFYPVQVSEHHEQDECTKRLSELKFEDSHDIAQKGWYLLSNCDEIYPQAYGIEHNSFADTATKSHKNKI